jgi:Leucine-rich repeat (LRR) protein
MCSKLTIAALLLAGFIASLNAQILRFEMDCAFEDVQGSPNVEGYTCTITGVDYDFSTPFYFIRVGGEHLAGRTNADVRNLKFADCTMNRIPANIFNVFPNVEFFAISNCGTMSFIPPDFLFAGNVRNIRIGENTVNMIGPLTFVSVSNTEVLHLNSNGIATVHLTAFTGLTRLRELNLNNNRLTTITTRQLLPLINLEVFTAVDNQISQIDGRLFVHSPSMRRVDLRNNAINAVGSSFLNINENLEELWFSGNQCASRDFVIGGDVDLRTIRNTFGACFENSPWGTQITLDVTGSLVIFDENEQLLLRID